MGTPIQLAELFNDSYTTGSDILSSDVRPQKDVSTLRVTCAFSAAGTLSAKLDQDGTDQSVNLNKGGSLTADALYTFDIPLGAATDLNFQYSVNATIRYFHVQEVSS